MKTLGARAAAELAIWGLAITGLVLVLDTGRRDDWIFLLVMVGGLILMVRVLVWSVRLDRQDSAANRFLERHARALYWTCGPALLIVLWTTSSFSWWTLILTCVAAVAAIGDLSERRSPTDGAAGDSHGARQD